MLGIGVRNWRQRGKCSIGGFIDLKVGFLAGVEDFGF